MLKAELKKIINLLEESVRYKVPDYQRNFEWKKEHIEEFYDDIIGGNSFLGTFVLDVHNEKNSEIFIVDGQQRLTTIFIFLAACKYQALKNNSINQSQVIQSKMSFIDATTGKAKGSKLDPSTSIKEIFLQTITKQDWDGKNFDFVNKKRQVNRIEPLYRYFRERISKFDTDRLADILKKLYECRVVKIEIEETLEAFDIFERTNARGLELNASDLLKNYLFQKNDLRNMSEEWDNININSSHNILRMIKYYYISNFGPVQKKILFKKLKLHGENVGADKLFSGIKNFSYYYSVVVNKSPDEILEWAKESNNIFFRKQYNYKLLNYTLDAITLFGVTQVYPLIIKLMMILSSIGSVSEKESVSKRFLEFLVSLEKFHFINYAICQRPGNQIEKYYADKCVKKVTSTNIIPFMKEVITELEKEKLASKVEFIEKFSELTYGPDSNLIYYISDRLNNYGRKGGQYVEIYNPDKRILRKNYNIDHLISQNTDNYEFDTKEIGEDIDNIGNLLVISLHTNGEMQNINIIEKFEILKEMEIQNLPEVRILFNSWKSKSFKNTKEVKANIIKRAFELAERSYSIIWKI